jgi:Ca2+-binding RTX toxin-like protein
MSERWQRTAVSYMILLAMIATLVLCVRVVANAQVPDSCAGQELTDFRATEAADYLAGTEIRDVIALGEGADQYFGDSGPDLICGNEGPDILGGEAGGDTIAGGTGADVVLGMGGPDDLQGNAGEDNIDGGWGSDIVRASLADDQRDDLFDGPGSDVIIGQPEDVWHRCGDDQTDDHSDFAGLVVPDPNC